MAIIHDTVVIDSYNKMPSLGMLLGSGASGEVFNQVDRHGYKSFFGDEFDHLSKEFFNRHVKPLDDLGMEISRTINLVMNPDKFRILDQLDDYRSIPSCMEIPILLFQPVRTLFEQGRIEGFGWDPNSLPEEDMFGRLIDNFTCEDVAAASDEEGYYDLQGTMYSTDPDLNDDELYAIRRSREYILNKILNATDLDPTAIDIGRG